MEGTAYGLAERGHLIAMSACKRHKMLWLFGRCTDVPPPKAVFPPRGAPNRRPPERFYEDAGGAVAAYRLGPHGKENDSV